MSKPLEELPELDRSFLYVFVAGPGFGEGIAIALPDSGWLLVDGCRTPGPPRDNLPLLHVLRRWRMDPDRDPVRWMIITHPHEDHAGGFAEVLDAVNPFNVGMMGPPPPGRTLLEEIRSLSNDARFTEERLRARQVLAAAKAIERWEENNGRKVTPLHDGRNLLQGKISARICAPDLSRARPVLDMGWPSLRRRANELSIVIELLFCKTRIILGGDLPRTRSHRGTDTTVPTGWDHVLNVHQHLANHQGLKLPHHGSRHALHETILDGGKSRGTLWVTPHSKSRLPSPDRSGGLVQILASRSRVFLTALPTRRDQQPVHKHPARIHFRKYRQLIQTSADTGFLKGAADIRPPAVANAQAPVWAVSFDDEGNAIEAWRGENALELFP